MCLAFDPDRNGEAAVVHVHTASHFGPAGRPAAACRCLSPPSAHPHRACTLKLLSPGAGLFGLPEYTMMCLFLLSCKNIFRAFDPSGSGKISLDYSQFVYCAANTR